MTYQIMALRDRDEAVSAILRGYRVEFSPLNAYRRRYPRFIPSVSVAEVMVEPRPTYLNSWSQPEVANDH